MRGLAVATSSVFAGDDPVVEIKGVCWMLFVTAVAGDDAITQAVCGVDDADEANDDARDALVRLRVELMDDPVEDCDACALPSVVLTGEIAGVGCDLCSPID